jgi:hypothetical protein
MLSASSLNSLYGTGALETHPYFYLLSSCN